MKKIKLENIILVGLDLLILIVYLIVDKHIDNTFQGVTAWGLSIIALLVTTIMIYQSVILYKTLKKSGKK
jgi:hypothetical protein